MPTKLRSVQYTVTSIVRADKTEVSHIAAVNVYKHHLASARHRSRRSITESSTQKYPSISLKDNTGISPASTAHLKALETPKLPNHPIAEGDIFKLIRSVASRPSESLSVLFFSRLLAGSIKCDTLRFVDPQTGRVRVLNAVAWQLRQRSGVEEGVGRVRGAAAAAVVVVLVVVVVAGIKETWAGWLGMRRSCYSIPETLMMRGS